MTTQSPSDRPALHSPPPPSPRHRAALACIADLGLLVTLADYTPMFVGTIPIGVDIPGSDIDIICEAADVEAFARLVEEHFGGELGFRSRLSQAQGRPASVSSFQHGRFEIEVFAQPLPVEEQAACKHMMAEWRLLQAYGPRLRRAVRARKRRGVKTEPAFASALRLDGDPYAELLRVADMSEEALQAFVAAHPLVTRARRT